MDLTALPAVVDHDACDPDEVAEIMTALANPSRLEIVRLLADAELDVTELAHRLGASAATTSHHLGALRRAGLVTSRRHGTRILNRLADSDVLELCATACAIANPPGTRTRR
jgi:DNA-binding transcriptional ArsR family regulator